MNSCLLNSAHRRTWAEIDLDAAEHNFLKLKAATEGKLVCAVIKANAYGHGAAQLGMLYEELGVDYFAVSNFSEALELRCVGITSPILILGYTPPECVSYAVKHEITLSAYSYPYAKLLSEAATKAGVSVKIHLKFDTGMGRIGFFASEEGESSLSHAYLAARLPGLSVEGAFTHFAVADGGDSETNKVYTREQAEKFVYAKSYLISRGIELPICHISNSAAALDYPELSEDMVRLGISLYGLVPSFDVKKDLKLEPVMTLKSIITHIKTLEAGQSVSYGRTFVARRATRVATVPIGYADGFLRSSSKNGVCLTLGDAPVKILGRVCMDQLMVDVTDIPDVKLFSEITVFGKGAFETADSYADKNETIGYEAVCGVSRRVPRLYIRDGVLTEVADYLQ